MQLALTAAEHIWFFKRNQVLPHLKVFSVMMKVCVILNLPLLLLSQNTLHQESTGFPRTLQPHVGGMHSPQVTSLCREHCLESFFPRPPATGLACLATPFLLGQRFDNTRLFTEPSETAVNASPSLDLAAFQPELSVPMAPPPTLLPGLSCHALRFMSGALHPALKGRTLLSKRASLPSQKAQMSIELRWD